MFSRKKKEKKEQEKTQQVVESSFSSLILMLATGIYTNLGFVPDPITKNKNKNLELAQNTIDILDTLKKKTQGNLTKEEEGLLLSILHEVKTKYVEVKKKEGK